MKSVSQNTIYYLTGSIAQKVLVFFYFIFLARYLGPDLIGRYTFAISFVSIFAVLMDFGLNQLLIRQTAKDKDTARNYLGSILGIKLILSFFNFLIIIGLIKLLAYPTITQYLIYLIATALILDNFTNTIYSALRGYRNLKYEGIGLALYQFVVLVIGLIFIFLKLSLPYMGIPLAIGSFFNLIFSTWVFYRLVQTKLLPRFDFPNFLFLLKSAMPFFLVGVFGTIYSYIDVILLSKLGGDRYVGFYSTGGKIPAGLRILPIAFSAALYPAASFYFKEQKENLRRLIERVFFYLIFLTLPIAFGLWGLADIAIKILYGNQFLEAISVLRVLSWSIIFVFFDYIFVVILNACDKERINMINRALAMILIIVLNLICIPSFKHLGSAIAFTLSFAFLSFLGGRATWREVKFVRRDFLKKFLKTLLASLLMVVVVLLLKSRIHFVFVILIGALVYLLATILLRLIRKDEIDYFKILMKGFLKIRR
jgi:O-antigen/teichoic acid export membrane protein